MTTNTRFRFCLSALLMLLVFSYVGNAQTTIFQFDFEAGTTVSTDNAVGTPTFSQIGTVGVTTGACNGTAGRNANGWDANDALRFTVNTTGYSAMSFSYLERTSNINVGTLLVRVSTDLTNWTTIRTSYTPTTTCASSGNLSIPAGFNNQATVYIEIFKINTGTATTTFRIDDATLTGTAAPVCPTLTFSTSKIDVLCNGASTGSITVSSPSGGTAPYTYSSNNGTSYQAGATFSSLAAATYQIKIKDANGCESSATGVTVNQPSTLPSFTFSQSNVTTFGGNDGSITVSATGGTAGYTYSNDNGTTYQASNVFNSLTAATYQVKVKDLNGCETAAQAVTITQPLSPVLSATFTATNITCNGANNGQIQFTVSGGITPYVLAITGPVNGTQNLASAGSYTFTGLPAGSYLCEVLDNNLDIVSDTRVITQPTAFSFTTSKTDVVCFGASTGSITVNGATGGTGALQYSINNGTTYQVSNSFTGLTSGTYQVKIKDASNCESTAQSVTINGPLAALSFTTSKTDVTCFGAANGSITVNTVTGGTSPYIYSNDNGATYAAANTFLSLSAGTYQIKVKDANNCETNAAAVIINQPAAVTFTHASANVTCFGAGNGSITVTAAGGSGSGYIYSNNNGTNYQVSNSFTGLSAGTYTLLVRDGNNCVSAPSTATITEPADFTVTNANTNIACNGGNNGAIDISVSGGVNCNNGPGLLISKVMMDPTGSDAAQEFVEVIATRDINFATTPYTVIVANNGTGTASGWVTGGSLTYAFQINTGTATAGGVYYVGGTSMSPATNRLRAINITTTGGDGGIGISQATAGVFGNGTGNADGVAVFASAVGSITSSTVPVDAVLWGDAVGNAFVTTATGYQLPVNDIYNGGKIQTTSTVFSTPSTNNVLRAAGTFDALTGTFTTARTFTNVAFVNGTSGITLNNFGPQYTYNWGGGITTQDRTNLTAGTYNLTVTNCNGCSKPSSYTITQPAVLSAGAIASNVSCNGGTNGAVNATVTGGTVPYTFAWSNGATTEDLTGVVAGTFTVTVTDANGCNTTATATVAQPAVLSASAVATDVICNGNSNGAVDATVTGGTAPYTFSWSNGATTEDIAGLVAGTYTITVTDANGCNTTATATVTQPTTVSISLVNANDAACFGANNGSIDITATGGNSMLDYLWSNGSTNQDISGLVAGNYIVTASDNLGCSAVASFTINQPSTLSINTVATNVSCFNGTNGAINATITGGTPTYTHLWSNGSVNEDISGLTFGFYSLTVTDNNGCVATVTNVLVDEPQQLTVTAVNAGPYQVGQTAAFNSNPVGGTSPYTYVWAPVVNGSLNSPLIQNPTISNVQLVNAGTYSVVVTDNNGCTASANTTLSVIGTVTSVTWNGSTSNNWHNPVNWTPNVVPNATINVIMPVGTPNSPNISTSDAAVKNISFTGAGLSLTSVQAPYQLSVKGNWVGNNNTVVQGTGAVVFDQPAATIAGTNTINIARINANTTILASANFIIMNELQINGGVLTTNNKLTIRSNAAGTARIAPILSGSITGQVTQERYIGPGPLAYEYVASAVAGQTIGQMSDDIGIRVGAGASVYWYNEALPGNLTSSGFTAFTSLSNPIPAHRGIAAYMYARPKTIDFTGLPYTGTQNIPVTYTNSGSPVDDGYNLVANPYLSGIDWDALTGWTRTNIDPTIYILNPVTNNNVSYNHVTNIGTGGFNGKIASGQSFFVQATATSPVLSLTEDVKTTGAVFYKNDEQLSTYLRVHIKGENGNGDEMILGFADNATAEFDRNLDASKLSNGYVDAALVSVKGEHLTQQFISTETESAVIPVMLNTNGEVGNFTISFENVSSVNKEMYLRDNLTGSVTEITAVAPYAFAITNANKGQAENRFDILIGKQNNQLGDMFEVVVYPNPASSKFNVVLGNNATATSLQIFDLVGKLVYSGQNLQANHIEVDANDFESGTYMIEVTANGIKQTQRVVINK